MRVLSTTKHGPTVEEGRVAVCIRTCAYQGVINVYFFGKLGALCFLETLVLRFALLPYYRRVEACKNHVNHIRPIFSCSFHFHLAGTVKWADRSLLLSCFTLIELLQKEKNRHFLFQRPMQDLSQKIQLCSLQIT